MSGSGVLLTHCTLDPELRDARPSLTSKEGMSPIALTCPSCCTAARVHVFRFFTRCSHVPGVRESEVGSRRALEAVAETAIPTIGGKKEDRQWTKYGDGFCY